MSRKFIEELNKWRPTPLPDGDAGHDQLAAELAVADPNLRQQFLEELEKALPENPNLRQFAEHHALKRKLKAAHEAYKKVGR